MTFNLFSIFTLRAARMSSIFFFTLACSQLRVAFAQSSTNNTPRVLTYVDSSCKFNIQAILIEGNKKTKQQIILRELKFKQGDSVLAAGLFERLQQSQQLIYNTNLFSTVELRPEFDTSNNLTIRIKVLERWYIFPTPQFSLTDRNFNEWWKTFRASLDRVIYGIKFTHYNLSGRADQLNVYVLNGFSRNFYLNYSNPYINSAMTKGFSAGLGYAEYRTYPYKTSRENKILFFQKDAFTRKSISVGGTYRQRKGFYLTNLLSVQYNFQQTDDSVQSALYNPNYFNNGKNKAGFLDLTYALQYVNTNNVNYPLTGKIMSASISKRGFGWKGGINVLSIEAAYRRYFDLKRNYYMSFQWMGRLRLPFEQAYINQRALGYGEYYLRGMEYYVVDGVASAMTKLTFSKKIIDKKIRLPFKMKAIPFLPIRLFAKAYTDQGYVHSQKKFDTYFNNRFLYSGGMGLDIISLYDMKLSIEYSANQLGEKGLFLHAKSVL